MVGGLYSESRGSGFRPGSVIVLCSWPKHFTVMVSSCSGTQRGTSELSGKPDEMLGG